MALQLLSAPITSGNRRLPTAFKLHSRNAGSARLLQIRSSPRSYKGVLHVVRCSSSTAGATNCCSSDESKQDLISVKQQSSGVWELAKVLLPTFVAWFVSLGLSSGVAYAAAAPPASSPESIGASALGLHIATFLRKSSWPDEAIVFTLATLPVLELRGAIPVGHWMSLDPLKVYLLAIAGNMVPVPLILLYLDKLSTFVTLRSPAAKKVLDSLYKSTRRKAGPIQEFKWLGLMLFVAVPFPGTGAWTGAIAAVVLGMSFWSSLWANFFGVVIAGILVNMLVSLGLKTALLVGAALFAGSTFMWSFLRLLTSRRAGA